MEEQGGRQHFRELARRALGGKGNEGVAGVVKQTPNSIGYVELIYAVQNKMSYGEVKNSAGKFLQADLNSGDRSRGRRSQEHAGGFPRFDHQRSRSNRISHLHLHLDADSQSRFRTPPRANAIKAFLQWMLTDGQKYAAGLGYAPLPKEVVAKMKQIADQSQMQQTSNGSRMAHWPLALPAALLETTDSDGRQVARLVALAFAASILLLTVVLVRELWVSSALSRHKFGLEVPDLQHVEPGDGGIRRASVHLRYGGHLAVGAADLGAAGAGRGDLSLGIGARPHFPTPSPF